MVFLHYNGNGDAVMPFGFDFASPPVSVSEIYAFLYFTL
jgi:hypothetical protein